MKEFKIARLFSLSCRNVPIRGESICITLHCFNCTEHYYPSEQHPGSRGIFGHTKSSSCFPIGLTKEDFWWQIRPNVSPFWTVLNPLQKMWFRDLCWVLFWFVFKAIAVRLSVLNFAGLEKWMRLSTLSKRSAYSCVSLDALHGRHLHDRFVYFLRVVTDYIFSWPWCSWSCIVLCIVSLPQLLSHCFGKKSLLWGFLWVFFLCRACGVEEKWSNADFYLLLLIQPFSTVLRFNSRVIFHSPHFFQPGFIMLFSGNFSLCLMSTAG